MTDLEITRLCAEAMGLSERRHPIAPVTPPAIWVLDAPHELFYNPLHDDAQAMALGRKFPEEFKAAINEWAWQLSKGVDFNLNSYLCGRIAERQNELKTR